MQNVQGHNEQDKANDINDDAVAKFDSLDHSDVSLWVQHLLVAHAVNMQVEPFSDI